VTAQHEQRLHDLCQHLEAALTQRGVTQEILLLRLLNEVIDQSVTTATDWRSASALEYRRWREQAKKILDSLGFMIASADSYAQEATGLAGEATRLAQQLSAIEQGLEMLDARKVALTAELNQGQLDVAALQREVELLQTLKALAPFRAAIAERIDEQRLRALANCDLAREHAHQRERIERLAGQIDGQLAAMDALLRQDLMITEQDWVALRKALTA
jgi:chromosome segregation ATPase